MKVNVESAPERVREGHGIESGNVYQNLRGDLYIIVNVHERDSLAGARVTALVCDRLTGDVVGAVCYGQGYFERRKLLGVATNLPTFIEIDWF